jgi:molecular chaperone GrpE
VTEEEKEIVKEAAADAFAEAALDAAEEPAAEKEEEEQPSDELEALRQAIEEAQTKEAQYLDGWQRARAELANARKRFQREREQTYANAKADMLARLLPIVDDLERAFETLPHNLSGLTWIEGMALIQRKLQLLLEQNGVEPIATHGEEFDPLLHQAVTHEPSDTVPVGHVIGELQKGYRMGDRVLRPSMVRVSAGPPAQPAGEGEVDPVEGEAPSEEETPTESDTSTDDSQA